MKLYIAWLFIVRCVLPRCISFLLDFLSLSAILLSQFQFLYSYPYKNCSCGILCTVRNYEEVAALSPVYILWVYLLNIVRVCCCIDHLWVCQCMLEPSHLWILKPSKFRHLYSCKVGWELLDLNIALWQVDTFWNSASGISRAC